MSDTSILASTRRRAIIDIVRREPGVTLSQLVRKLASGWGSVHLHVQKLEEAGMIVRQRVGRRVMLFPAGDRDAGRPQAYAVLHGRTARRIAAAIAEGRGEGILRLSEDLDLTPRVTYYHVKRLISAGLITSASPSRHVQLSATERLREALTVWDDAP